MSFIEIPLSLYVHIPWCVRKCPYCDFNSHQAKGALPEEAYVAVLLRELAQHLGWVRDRSLVSVFFGGGTPSLFSGQAIEQILSGVSRHIKFDENIEITLEANPGTIDQARFHEFRSAGINRLSLGIQSLQDDKLKALGRIHDRANAMRAIELAKAAGFDNFNLDLMFGLPGQSVADALQDLECALDFQPAHLSWYQLTIEPNTMFHHRPPALPQDETIWDMQTAGQALLDSRGFRQYEVSAYALPGRQCRHNLNYWEFGDYLGIGAGAHSKLTDPETGTVHRFAQVKNPRDYLQLKPDSGMAKNTSVIAEKDVVLEFMLNALRLTEGIPADLFTVRTGIPLQRVHALLDAAKARGLLLDDESRIIPSDLGRKFLNDLTAMFLPE